MSKHKAVQLGGRTPKKVTFASAFVAVIFTVLFALFGAQAANAGQPGGGHGNQGGQTVDVAWQLPGGQAPAVSCQSGDWMTSGDCGVNYPQTLVPNVSAAPCGVWLQVDEYPKSAAAVIEADGKLTAGEDSSVVIKWKFEKTAACAPTQVAVPTLTPGAATCTASGTLPALPTSSDWTARWNRAFNGAGSYTATFTINAGVNKVFPNGTTTAQVTVTVPDKLSGGACTPDNSNQKITFCHAEGNGNYQKITTSVWAFWQSGHINHKDDIYPAGSVTHQGQTHSWDAQGDQSLLAENCCPPKTVVTTVQIQRPTTSELCVAPGNANDTVTFPEDTSVVGYHNVGTAGPGNTVTSTPYLKDTSGKYALSDDSIWSYTFKTLDQLNCATPPAPTIETYYVSVDQQQECVNGSLTDAVVTITEDADVQAYGTKDDGTKVPFTSGTHSGSELNGITGFEFVIMKANVTFPSGDTDESVPVLLTGQTAANCTTPPTTTVTAINASPSEPTCSDTEGSVVTDEPEGVQTLLNGEVIANGPHILAAGDYTLTFKALKGYTLSNPDFTQSFTITATPTDCSQPVTPSFGGATNTAATCQADVPYLHVHVVVENPDGTPLTGHEVYLIWQDSKGHSYKQDIGAFTGNSGTADYTVLWPGATVNSKGEGLTWPGWTSATTNVGDGNYGWTRTLTSATLELNPTASVKVSYPSATSGCATPPPAKSVTPTTTVKKQPPTTSTTAKVATTTLATTGSSINLGVIWGAIGLVVLGVGFVLVRRRKTAMEATPAERE